MTFRMRNLLTGLIVAAFVPLAPGCRGDYDDNDADGLDPSPLVGTWSAESVTTPSGNAIANGMSLTAVLGASGTASLNVTGDQLSLCNPGPNCTLSGTYTSTANTISIVTGTGTIALNYTINGDDDMTWTGTVEGVNTTFVFDKQ